MDIIGVPGVEANFVNPVHGSIIDSFAPCCTYKTILFVVCFLFFNINISKMV